MEGTTRYKPELNQGWSDRYREPEQESVDTAIFYTAIRQQGARAELIGFVLKSQRHHLLPTHDIREIFYQPEQGIWVFFGFATVHIEGRNLTDLYRLMQERKVKEVREFCEEPHKLFTTDSLVIERITYESDYLHHLEKT